MVTDEGNLDENSVAGSDPDFCVLAEETGWMREWGKGGQLSVVAVAVTLFGGNGHGTRGLIGVGQRWTPIADPRPTLH